MSALKPTLAMFKLAKKHKLIPEHCNEYEFTIAQTSDDEIICFGVEYWPTNKRTDKPIMAGIPAKLQPSFNAYARRVIKPQYE